MKTAPTGADLTEKYSSYLESLAETETSDHRRRALEGN